MESKITLLIAPILITIVITITPCFLKHPNPNCSFKAHHYLESISLAIKYTACTLLIFVFLIARISIIKHERRMQFLHPIFAQSEAFTIFRSIYKAINTYIGIIPEG